MTGDAVWLLLTAGRGPGECALAVAGLVPLVEAEARERGLDVRLVEHEAGEAGLLSALLSVEGEGAEALARAWEGPILWICPSPLRPGWPRKNWFVAGSVLRAGAPQAGAIADADLRWETFRARGAGGQHVNKTESGVRLRHLPSGIVVACQAERSQHRNRALALARLKAALDERAQAARRTGRQEAWRRHDAVERGASAAVRVYRGPGFARER